MLAARLHGNRDLRVEEAPAPSAAWRSDLVPAGIQRLADPDGDQVKILVPPTNGARA